MFCPNCGKEIKDGAPFCGECGAKLNTATEEKVPAGSSPDAVPVSTASSKGKASTAFIAKIFVLVALICFFMPFMTISCADKSVSKDKVKVTGTDMIFGDKDISEQKEDEGGSGSIFNIFVCVAAVAGVVALLPIKKTALFSGISALSLVVFRLTATSYYKIGERTLKEASDYIKVRFGFALYIAIILLVLAVFYALSESSAKKSKPPS